MLSRYGATDVEPGMALAGSAPYHAWLDMPEKPAQVVVSEVMHRWDDELLALGGCFSFVWSLGDGLLDPPSALVGSTFEAAVENRITLRSRNGAFYHGAFSDCERAQVGDTVIFAHHPQAQSERGYTATVAGISTGRPTLTGLFDSTTTPIDPETFHPIPLEIALATQDRVAQSYSADSVGRASAANE